MSLIEVQTPTVNIDPGTYEMVLVKCELKVIDSFVGEGLYGPDDGKRLIWTWGDPEDDTVEIDGLSTLSTGPRSRTYEILTALLGPEAVQAGVKFDEKDLVGKKALVSIELNEKGYPRVAKVTALPTKRTGRPRPVIAAETDETTDNLPF